MQTGKSSTAQFVNSADHGICFNFKTKVTIIKQAMVSEEVSYPARVFCSGDEHKMCP